MADKERLENLRQALMPLSDQQLEDHLKKAGALDIDDDEFGVFADEYKRRGLRLPA